MGIGVDIDYEFEIAEGVRIRGGRPQQKAKGGMEEAGKLTGLTWF